MIKKQRKNFASVIVDAEKSIEREAIEDDFKQTAKLLMIIKDMFPMIGEDDMSPYFAQLVQETKDKVYHLYRFVEEKTSP